MPDEKPETVAVTLVEGGEWLPFSTTRLSPRGSGVHAIEFSDGSVWDTMHGWRTGRPLLEHHASGWDVVEAIRDLQRQMQKMVMSNG